MSRASTTTPPRRACRSPRPTRATWPPARVWLGIFVQNRGVRSLCSTLWLVAALLMVGAACPGPPSRAPTGLRVGAVAGPNLRVTDDGTGTYVRADGGSDRTTGRCGASRFPQNEPSVAVDPRRSNIMVVGANDVCAVLGGGSPWVGVYRSLDAGRTWVSSLVPGYVGDTSPAGLGSPVRSACSAASDPSVAFDQAGRLYFGFICFNSGGEESGAAVVATYDQDGARYVASALAAGGSTGGSGALEDKVNLTVDPSRGTVYVAWAEFGGGSEGDAVMVSRSIDHGARFSSPVRATPNPGQFAELSVGPDGTLYLAYRAFSESAPDQSGAIELVRSTDGGRSFGPPITVASINPFESTTFSGSADRRSCGDGRATCPTGYTYPRFTSSPAVVADNTGVHVVWNERLPFGQSKVFFRNSPDGSRWPRRPATIDHVTTGHQFMPAIASSGGAITVAFYDSRVDPAFSAIRPPGNTATGTNPGPSLDVYAAQSADGGMTWSETRVTSVSSNPNLELAGLREPFIGDYIYVSAVSRMAFVVWTDSRDVVPGRDPRERGAKDDHDGLDVDLSSCARVGRACLSRGGLDQNVYGAALRF